MKTTSLKTGITISMLSEKYKLPCCKYKEVTKGYRRCTLCKEQIKKGTEFYKVHLGTNGYGGSIHINICIDCSYVSIMKLLKLGEGKC